MSRTIWYPWGMERGKLIVFEGVDGTGKSTQIDLLKLYLAERGKKVVTSFEPTHGEWGMRVRAAAVSGKRLSVQDEVECLLRDRREHVKRLILPALAENNWVLLDRYYPSMMAYQGATGGDVAEIRRLNEIFAPAPDLAFWLDIPVQEALRRIQNRGQKKDAFEQADFLQAVARIYGAMDMPWWRRIPANGEIAETQALIRCEITMCLEPLWAGSN